MSRLGSTGVADARRGPADPTSPRPVDPSVHDLGEGRLERGPPNGRPQRVLRIDVTGAAPNLLARLLVGSYITGQDQVLVTARGGLTASQRTEVHRVVDRILGMTVVGDAPEAVVVQNFLDPGKYGVPRLLHRVVQMLHAELDLLLGALSEKEDPQFELFDTIEEEVDRIYLLMVRQLLLSSDSPRIARDIDVENHHFQIGDRLVAKVLEVVGDLLHGIGAEVKANRTGLRRLPRPVTRRLVGRIERLRELLTRTMDAFGHLSVVDANATLNTIGEELTQDERLGPLLTRHAANRKTVAGAESILCHLNMALEMLVVVNEVTINRCVEPETAQFADGHLSLSARAVPRSLRLTYPIPVPGPETAGRKPLAGR
jgi:phosphate uptake regulator